MDWTTILLFAFLIASYGAIGLAVYLVMREEQPRRQIKRRFFALVRRRPQWCCARCYTWFYGKPVDGPVCDACKWQAYLEYLEKVA